MTQDELIKNSEVLFDHWDIEEAIDDMADLIRQDLEHSNPVIICVMNGGMVFTSTLMSYLQFPMQFDYCQTSRYGHSETGGILKWKKKPEIDLTDRTVLICDDIFDEGYTLEAIVEYCKSAGAKEIKTAVLLNKTEKNKADIKPDYVGFGIEDLWVFGYGLDDAEYCRNLNEIRYKIST